MRPDQIVALIGFATIIAVFLYLEIKGPRGPKGPLAA